MQFAISGALQLSGRVFHTRNANIFIQCFNPRQLTRVSAVPVLLLSAHQVSNWRARIVSSLIDSGSARAGISCRRAARPPPSPRRPRVVAHRAIEKPIHVEVNLEERRPLGICAVLRTKLAESPATRLCCLHDPVASASAPARQRLQPLRSATTRVDSCLSTKRDRVVGTVQPSASKRLTGLHTKRPRQVSAGPLANCLTGRQM